MLVWPIAPIRRNTIEKGLEVEVSVDRRLPHGALGSFVGSKWLAFLDAERREHAHHHLVLRINGLGADNLVEVVEVTFVVERKSRNAIVDWIDETLLWRIACLRKQIHPQLQRIAVCVLGRFPARGNRAECKSDAVAW